MLLKYETCKNGIYRTGYMEVDEETFKKLLEDDKNV